jgi:hypothetical protein
MPPIEVYSVDFRNANLSPVPNHPWGNMKQGTTNPADHPESFGDSHGLNLSVYRSATTVGPSTNTVYVLPGAGVLPVESRLRMRLEFDLPWAQATYAPLTPPNHHPHGPNTTQAGSPWAVGIAVKFGNENDLPTDKQIAVTCQFNRTLDGVRLNTPGSLQNDPAANLESPLDYGNYVHGSHNDRFAMEFAFCGFKFSTIGHAGGNGALSIGNNSDQRVFSNAALSFAGAQTWIGALGVALVTGQGVGQIMVRLRTFSISIW